MSLAQPRGRAFQPSAHLIRDDAEALAAAHLAAAGPSLGQIPQNHFHALEVLRFGASEAQKARFFALALQGRRFGNALSAVFDAPTTVGLVAQIMHAAIDIGIGRAAQADTLRFVRERARPWIDSAAETAAEDPLTIRDVGETAVRLRAAEALLPRAGRAIEAAPRCDLKEAA